MTETITISGEELKNLKGRLEKLAAEKSYLNLLIHMMSGLSSVSGLENTVEAMLQVILNNIGGTNLILYYFIDADVYYSDVFGEKMKLDVIEDVSVKQVQERREPAVYEHDFSDTMMMTPEFTKAMTWVFPLLVGPDIVGVLKMEGMHVGTGALRQQLPTFFSYAALVLKNEILGYTRLRKAYDELHRVNSELMHEITQRQQAEEALRESELKFRSLFENAGDAIFLVKEDIFVDCNSKTLRIFQCRRDQIIGETPHRFSPPFQPDGRDSKEEALEKTHAAFAGNPQFFEWTHCRYDGTPFDAEVSLNIVGLGGVPYMHAIVRDVTERKRTEYALRESEERFRSMVETTSDWVWEVDQNGIYTYASPKIRELLGYEPEEVIGKSPFDLMPPKEAERVAGLFGEIVGSRKPLIGLENVNQHKDGRCVVLETSGVPIFDTKGNLLGYRGIDRDITVRKRVEEALRESEERFKNLYEESPIPTFTWQKKGEDFILVDFNRAAAEIADGRAGDYLDSSAAKMYADRPQILDDLNLCFHNQAIVKREVVSHDFAPGKFLSVHFGFIPPDLIIVHTEDQTDRKRMENELHKLNEQLEQKVDERTKQLIDAQEQLIRKEKLSILGQLAGVVGHEIRNPLGVINNAAYFLKTVMTDADDIVKEYLDIIKQEVANAQRIIADLLDFSRTKTPQIVSVAVNALATQALDRCAIAENIDVLTDIPDTLPRINVDPFQMGQVLQNLITNAIQAMPGGGTLVFAARQGQGSEEGSTRPVLETDFVEISITDTGQGISPENMQKLFQPLFTTKTKGIGLGLLVCKNLVEANGCRIEVRSEIGKGTIFTVTIPAHKTELMEPTEKSTDAARVQGTHYQRREV